jgi:hypothetical protein
MLGEPGRRLAADRRGIAGADHRQLRTLEQRGVAGAEEHQWRVGDRREPRRVGLRTPRDETVARHFDDLKLRGLRRIYDPEADRFVDVETFDLELISAGKER